MRKAIKILRKILRKSKIITRIYVWAYNHRIYDNKFFYTIYSGFVQVYLRLLRKKYYVVFRDAAICGLFSHLIIYLQMFAEAEKFHLKPIVDMKNHENPYIDEKIIGGGQHKNNAWNYFFADCVEGHNIDNTPLKKMFYL